MTQSEQSSKEQERMLEDIWSAAGRWSFEKQVNDNVVKARWSMCMTATTTMLILIGLNGFSLFTLGGFVLLVVAALVINRNQRRLPLDKWRSHIDKQLKNYQPRNATAFAALQQEMREKGRLELEMVKAWLKEEVRGTQLTAW